MVFRKEEGGKKAAANGKRGKTFGPAAQKAFLAHLAQTANVSASARTAGVTTRPVYDLRRKSEGFCTKWLGALAEGYARLEANLLSEALSAPASNLKDSTLKQKQMKTRIGMALLAAHRATVKGAAPMPAPSRSRDPKEVQQRLEARFAVMRKRLGDDGRTAE
ncbi:MAG: hypothetical protein IPG54_12280 [Sphingomonadales bacterium]|jgi:hypothetical protein|nr:hypothetical protein [Sphingomonadales bacterium]MBK9004462.1 hypothetical protein [Sphingomonadales bacterium]MBK9269648.1 hypothetical protein [Sphingomonadales bacterium]